jgi:hypothetical protein
MKKIAGSFFVCLSLAACGGRVANPVMVSQFGDQAKSCKALEFEMSNVSADMQRLLPDTDKTGKNVALGVAGWFLLVPWFFMDFKNAEQTEYEADRQRYNNLANIAMAKNCDVQPVQYPSVQQMKDKYNQQKKTQQKDGTDEK